MIKLGFNCRAHVRRPRIPTQLHIPHNLHTSTGGVRSRAGCPATRACCRNAVHTAATMMASTTTGCQGSSSSSWCWGLRARGHPACCWHCCGSRGCSWCVCAHILVDWGFGPVLLLLKPAVTCLKLQVKPSRSSGMGGMGPAAHFDRLPLSAHTADLHAENCSHASLDDRFSTCRRAHMHVMGANLLDTAQAAARADRCTHGCKHRTQEYPEL